MKRRTFLHTAAATVAATAIAPSILKAKKVLKFVPNAKIQGLEGDNITIIIEMFGGNDGLNTIVPAYNDLYYTLRPRLAYPTQNLHRFQTTDVYFAPSIVENVHNGGMLQLMETGRLAIIEGIGYDNPNLSHFRSEDIHLSGINSSDSSVPLLEGWLGRYFQRLLPNYPLEVPAHPLAVQIDNSLSLLFKTQVGDFAIALTDPDSFYQLGAGLNPLPDIPLKTGSTSFDNEFNFVHVIAQQSEMYSQAVKAAYDAGKDKVKVNYSEGLSQKLKLISALIAGGLQSKVYYVKLSNFDSHAQQMNADFTGGHPTLIGQVASSICEFLDDAVQQGWAERVAGFTISEFGRRAYDNASRGTDHGAASMQFVFGGHSDYINGGYYGQKPDLANLDVNGNVNYQFDFRRTNADFLLNWLGASNEDINAVFGEPFVPVGVLNPRTSSVNDKPSIVESVSVNVYPNPSNGINTVSFTMKHAGNVDVSVFNSKGQHVISVYKGFLDEGKHEFTINLQNSGAYILSINAEQKRFIRNFTIIK